ncbi:hypothetical protein GQ55_1G150700 [Panicum hallii var. hallii]|uniref:Uncharacterized protein n=1 Tax=Panicum hallii var. hallii TaxID=1504633 RepID=A0A2T7F5F4_9POAL|nr:hypothetical protein GQ55_1G150700 [Panicum hallii var. hallii]
MAAASHKPLGAITAVLPSSLRPSLWIPCLQRSPARLLFLGCSCYPAKSQTQPHFASSPDPAPVRSG